MVCYRLVVCCVSIVSGLEDIMNRTIQTSKGGTKLADLENHVYWLDYSWSDRCYWKCCKPGCKGRAITNKTSKNEVGPVEIIRFINSHTHAGNPMEPVLLEAAVDLKNLSSSTQHSSSRTVVSTILERASKLQKTRLPSNENLSRNVRRWRNKLSMAPHCPTANTGFDVPNAYTKTTLGENFLIHDSGKNDSTRIWIFGSETAVNDLFKSRHIAVDWTFRCCPSIFYQMFTLHIMENNTRVPHIFGLLSNKTE